jgi:nicotinate-nucleotide adenylyltransferase
LIGLLGGAFDPPHNGHVALAAAAKRQFGFDEFVVLVSARPGHKDVVLDVDTRLELVRAAFPDDDVELDRQARTVDMLRTGRWHDPLFLVGADEFCDFLTWKEPEGVLELARLGVPATRASASTRCSSGSVIPNACCSSSSSRFPLRRATSASA